MVGAEESVVDHSRATRTLEGDCCARMHWMIAGWWHLMIPLDRVESVATEYWDLQCRIPVSQAQVEMPK